MVNVYAVAVWRVEFWNSMLTVQFSVKYTLLRWLSWGNSLDALLRSKVGISSGRWIRAIAPGGSNLVTCSPIPHSVPGSPEHWHWSVVTGLFVRRECLCHGQILMDPNLKSHLTWMETRHVASSRCISQSW